MKSNRYKKKSYTFIIQGMKISTDGVQKMVCVRVRIVHVHALVHIKDINLYIVKEHLKVYFFSTKLDLISSIKPVPFVIISE